MKRFFCLALILSLVISNLAAMVFAESSSAEMEESSNIPAFEEVDSSVSIETTEDTSVADIMEAADTEPSVSDENTLDAEASQPATQPVEGCQDESLLKSEAAQEAANSAAEEPILFERTMCCNDRLGNSAALLDGYLKNIMYSNGIASCLGTAGRDHLSTENQKIYDSLAAMVCSVAEGTRRLAKQEKIHAVYTAEELGITCIWDGDKLTKEAEDHVFVQLSKVIFAVIEDHPYECYWIDKEHLMLYSFGYYLRTDADTGAEKVEILCSYILPVAPPYANLNGQVNQYGAYIEADLQKTNYSSTAHRAAERAQNLVLECDGMKDREKLCSYKQFICNEVSYDHDAASTGPNAANGSTAWQLISVFDGNPSTNVVCEGYSKAFQYLCDLSSFQSDIVCYQDIGMMNYRGSSGLHMWNIVEINGLRLLADITNSDLGSIGQDGRLFLVTAQRLPDGFQIRDISYTNKSPAEPLNYLPDDTFSYLLVSEKPATCETPGVKAHFVGSDGLLYVENRGDMQEVREDQLRIPALGHAWSVAYHWSEDGSSCTATHTCGNNTAHNETCTAVITSEVTLKPTATEMGETTYTASFQAEWAATQTLTLRNIPVSEEPGENYFVDIPQGLYCYDSVNWAVKNNITNGLDSEHFGPKAPCVRRHVMMFLWRSKGCPDPASMENPFEDVKHDSFEKAILWAYYSGITTGKDSTHFNPEDICTRKQIVTFLWRANGKPEPANTVGFPDVKQDRFAKPIFWAAENEITIGYKDGRFQPEANCTRGQIVTFLYRAQQK